MTGDLSKLTASGCQKDASASARKQLGKGFAKGGDVQKKAFGGMMGSPAKAGPPMAMKAQTLPAAPMVNPKQGMPTGVVKRAMGGAGKVRKGQASAPKKGK